MDSKPSILYAEDDLNLSMITTDHLLMNGFEVHHVKDGDEALAAFKKVSYNLIILDVMMPKRDGFEVARKIREANAEIPIIFLTAKSLKADKSVGFNLGADDYIVKPYGIEELIFKIKVFLKRSSIVKPASAEPQKYVVGEYEFVPMEQLLVHMPTQQKQNLTNKESEVLRILLKGLNEVVKRESILNQVWGNDDYFNGRSLDVFISRLRKLLAQDGRIEILNTFAVGFKLIVRQ